MQANAGKTNTEPVATVSKNPDGSYSIADPGRKFYGFLAGAPSAHGKFLDHTPTDLLDMSVGRMVIYDYNQSFPGGKNTMEFEQTFDSNNKPVLTIRFSNQDRTSVSRHDPKAILTYIENQQDKMDTEIEPTKEIDFSDMSTDEIYAYQDKLKSVGDKFIHLLAADFSTHSNVDLWNIRMYEQRTMAA